MSYLVIVLCYLIGGIPFGLLIGRLNRLDIRAHGSGNIGATNVWRTLGRGWGLTCFALDALKGYVSVSVVQVLAEGGHVAGWTPIVAVFAAVAGHVWSPYLKFKGGKGIATSAGALLAVAALPVLVALVVWCIVMAATRLVSLASICGAIVLPLAGIGINLLSEPNAYDRPTLGLLVLLCIVAVLRHRGNIRRLLKGTEPRMGKKEG